MKPIIFFFETSSIARVEKRSTWLELDDEMKPEATWAIFFP